MTMRSRLWLIALLGVVIGCNNPDFQSNIPSVPVNIEVDLSSIDNIDLQQMGIGGNDSWGALPLEKYQLPYLDYSYRFLLRPLVAGEEAPLELGMEWLE